ncbi:helix-turn-helix domain-containing protein [Maritimibacter fusiformis]|uniref:Helix-turn-helix domain-containing protein n=1 Tax=Maritimibacter fusiformis TaxID=2603819 RepID=A0A5D0RL08_9RHOB|nr:helix-turn-helix domain-containing protein [Maritimibacter fusiformis]TYB82300.1 helix-turn-helix domain-containing protein [Maritimibacter fusiformis]
MTNATARVAPDNDSATGADPDTGPVLPTDPKPVREKAGLTSEEMAGLMGMSRNGYEAWENGARRPGGPAFRLLRLISDDPARVIAALGG